MLEKLRRKMSLLQSTKRLFKKILSKNIQVKSFSGEKLFQEQLLQFRSLLDEDSRFSTKDICLYPCLEDAKKTTPFDAHYVYHPAWAMRIIVEQNHIDRS